MEIFACVIDDSHFLTVFWIYFGVPDQFGIVIRFNLRHKSVVCMDLVVGPTSVGSPT